MKRILPLDNSPWVHLSGVEELESHDLPVEVRVHLEDDGTRPFLLPVGNGYVVNLRAFNFSPDHPFEDMISMRCWLRADSILTVSKQAIRSVDELRSELPLMEEGVTVGQIWHLLVTRLIENMVDVIRDLQDQVDVIEDQIVDAECEAPAVSLNQLRRSLIRIGRFLHPQRDIFPAAQRLKFPGTSDMPLFPADISQDAVRYVEDLAAVREHCVIMQDEITSQNTGQMNHRMLILSIAGCIFLPLSFIAGLLGMNVGGIPGATSSYAFAVVCFSMLLLSAVLLIWMAMRRMW